MPVVETSNTPLASRATERGVAPHQELAPIQGEVAHIPAQNPHSLPSIRGMLGDHRLSNFDRVVRGHSFSQEQSTQLAEIWSRARMDPRSDEGALLRQLLPTLQNNPELLTQLHRVATSDHLFGRDKSDQNFERMRREFLSDLIRGAVDSRNITQGPGAMCTAASMLKALPPAELIRLSCGFALDGRVTTVGGKDMVMRPEFFQRAEISSNAEIENIRCRRPSAGMLMVLDGVIELGVPNTTHQSGSYWWQYTDAWRNLRGHESACAGRDATIHVNADGQALNSAAPGSRTVTQMDYLLGTLGRPDARVLIDTEWNHSSGSTGMSADHSRHMLVARGATTRHGAEYIMCENPIGDFVDTSRSYRGHAEYFPTGTVLGDRNGFWFETAENGMVLIRRDVLERHLQTVLVDYQDRYVASAGGRPIGLGTLTTGIDRPITFVRGDEAAKRADADAGVASEEHTAGPSGTETVATSSKDKREANKDGRSRSLARNRRRSGASLNEDSVWDAETGSWGASPDTKESADEDGHGMAFAATSARSSSVSSVEDSGQSTHNGEPRKTTVAATSAIFYDSNRWGSAWQPAAEKAPTLTAVAAHSAPATVTAEREPATEVAPVSSEAKTTPQSSSFLTRSLFGEE